MASKERTEANLRTVEIPNKKITNVFGEPFELSDGTLDNKGVLVKYHADAAEMFKAFLRQREPGGTRSLVIQDMKDSEHVRAIGPSLNGDGSITLAESDFRWLLKKFEEHGPIAFPTDAAMLVDLLKDHKDDLKA